eukprot:m.118871 g.118871  ORF g.118871 m.118871 type:complete len:140 (-) comp14294_c1_seq1:2611-3030(-)
MNLNSLNPDGCEVCSCNGPGVAPGNPCQNGSCVCRQNVAGTSCTTCKQGYYNLSDDNPLGCQVCDCYAQGFTGSSCNSVSGQCPCLEGYTGLRCSKCVQGFYMQEGECKQCICGAGAINETCSSTGDHIRFIVNTRIYM